MEEEDNLETFSLIWLDALVNNSQEKLTIQRQLRSLINNLKTFVDEYQCENYIESTSDDDRIVFIVSGQFGKDFVPRIHQLRQISSIYVFCTDKRKNEIWANQYRKIKCVTTQSDALISQIEIDQTRRNENKSDEPLSISIFNENSNKTAVLLPSIDNELTYSQFLINSLLQMKTLVKDKNELINFCKNYFRQNDEELFLIKEFEKQYTSLKALWWFTRNSFLSRIITKAFRRKNFYLLFLSRFFLQDIYRQIQQKKSLKPVVVYRSQILSKKQLEIFQNSIGRILSINSFLVTTITRKQSLAFLKESIIIDDSQRVLFEIDADPKLSGIRAFANITSLSYLPGKQQILFMPGVMFRIVNIHNDPKQISIIRMTLSTNSEPEFKSIYSLEQFDLLSFGQMLIDMKKYNEAEIYFLHLLADLPFEHSDIPICYDALGSILLEKGQYDSSLKWFKKSLGIKKQTLDSNHPSIASIHNSIALIYLKKNDSRRALESYDTASSIFKQKFGETDSHISECFNNMAMVYKNENKYEKALDFYQKTLSIQEKSLSVNHPDLAMSQTNLGMAYSHLKQYDLALEHYNRALKIYEQILPLRHCLISMIFENIGNIYYDKNQFDQGLLYYEKAAAIYRHLLPSTHPDVLQIEIIIRRIKSKLKYC